MEEYENVKFGDICDFVRGPFGGSLKKNSFVNDGFAVYEQQHAIYNQFNDIRYYVDEKKFQEMKRFELQPKDIIMSCSGTMGKVAIVPNGIKRGIINQALLKLTPKSSLNVEYLKYWMTSPQFDKNIQEYSAGSAIKNVASVKVLKQIYLPLHPINKQKQIVETLDKAFEKIDKAIANIERNIENAEELFNSYLQNVFENKGDDWEEKKIIEICRLINGKAYKKKELLNEGKYRVLRVGNLFTNKHWYHSDLELAEDKYIDKGDLIYAWSASFGPRIWTEEKVIYHYHIWKVIPDNKLVTKEFLHLLFEWDKEKIKKAQGTGTTMIHVGKGSMEDREILLPPLNQQKQIVKNLNYLKTETKKLEAFYTQKIADLEEMKKSILEKAFKGELTSAA